MTQDYRILQFGQPDLIGDVIAGIHSGGDVICWEERHDVIVVGSSQFGGGMWYLREDGQWHGERVFVSTPLPQMYGYPKVFDWNSDGMPDVITWDGAIHLWQNQGGSPNPRFEHTGIVRIDDTVREQLDGSISQIECVPLNEDCAVLVGCDDWSDYWPGTVSPWSNLPNPQLGLGKSYDACGKWSGGQLRAHVWMLALQPEQAGWHLDDPQMLRMVSGEPVTVEGTAAPAVVDLNGDGVWDMILGDFGDALTYFRNVGSCEEPVFLPGVRICTPAGELELYHNLSRPRAVDWSGDGPVDLLIGQENGRLYLACFLELRSDGVPVYTEPASLQQRDPELSVGSAATPVLCDWDGDGDEDLIVGDAGGDVQLFENIGTLTQPRFELPVKLQAGGQPIRVQAGKTGSIQGPAEAKYGYTCPIVVDWDGDGLPDLILSDVTGYHTLFQNVGTRTAPELAAGERLRLAGEPLRTVWRVRPWAIDWDGDGAAEYLTLDESGWLTLYKQQREQGITALKLWMHLSYEDGARIKLDGPAGHEGRTKLHIADWTGSGTWDILCGIKGNQPLAHGVNGAFLLWLENVGTNEQPCFRHPVAVCDATGHRLAFGGHAATPNISGLYGPNQRMLLVGAEDGRVYCFDADGLSAVDVEPGRE